MREAVDQGAPEVRSGSVPGGEGRVNRLDMMRARLVLWASRVRPALRKLTGRCPSCPGRLNGRHKFSCSYNRKR